MQPGCVRRLLITVRPLATPGDVPAQLVGDCVRAIATLPLAVQTSPAPGWSECERLYRSSRRSPSGPPVAAGPRRSTQRPRADANRRQRVWRFFLGCGFRITSRSSQPRIDLAPNSIDDLARQIAKLWPHRRHESSAPTSLLCCCGIHYWRSLSLGALYPSKTTHHCF